MDAAPHGVIPAIPTPFTADGGEVDVEALRRVVRHVVDGGVHGIMTTGGTGEFPHLSREERRCVTEVVAAETAGAVHDLRRHRRPARRGRRSRCRGRGRRRRRRGHPGAAVLLRDPGRDAVPPLRGRRGRGDPAGRRLQQPALHRQPPLAGADRRADGARRRSSGSSSREDDLGQLVEALRLAGGSGRDLCTGIDSQFYAALCVGARGIFSTAAVDRARPDGPPLGPRPGRRPRRRARRSTRALQPLNRFLEYDPGYVSPTKEALRMLGLDCGPVRRPLPDFPEAERPALRDGARRPGRTRAGARSHEARHLPARLAAGSRRRRRRAGRRPAGGVRRAPRRGRA